MEAPKCRLCGKPHWERVCPNAQATLTIDHGDGVRRTVKLERLPQKGGTITIKFDRNAYHRAYMKEYMRKRRAKEAGK